MNNLNTRGEIDGNSDLNEFESNSLPDYSDTEISDVELNDTIKNFSINQKSNKRQRDSANTSTSSTDNPTKRRRSVEMFPAFAAIVANESFVVDILPVEENGLLTDNQGKSIKNSITRALFASENFANIKFESSGFERGKFRIICKDTVTRDWVIGIAPNLDGLWAGANLRAVTAGEPAKLVRSTINVVLPCIEPDDMFTIIHTQNPTINTENWKLYSRSKAQAGKQQWIVGVDEASIPALRELGCRPYCGMGRIRIFLPNNAV